MSSKVEKALDKLPGWLRSFVEIFIKTVQDFLADGGPRLSAAIAYYMLIALAPLLVLAITGASVLLERDEARDAVVDVASQVLEEEALEAVEDVLDGVMETRMGGGTTAVSVLVALLGASAAFTQIQKALNIAWDVPPRAEGFVASLRRRLWAFVLVLVIGVLLLVSILFSAGIGDTLEAIMPNFPGMAWVTERLISLVGGTVVFAAVFTILPEKRIDWRETLVGAFVTALLFTVGSVAMGEYFSRSDIGSAYGAAGSFAVLLVWLYYSTHVFLFGAEFTHVWAERRGAIGES